MPLVVTGEPVTVRPVGTVADTDVTVPVLVVYPAPFVKALLFKEMSAVPSKETPAIKRAVCNAVAVPAFPVTDVWSPVFVPDRFEPVIAPVALTSPCRYVFVMLVFPIVTEFEPLPIEIGRASGRERV